MSTSFVALEDRFNPELSASAFVNFPVSLCVGCACSRLLSCCQMGWVGFVFVLFCFVIITECLVQSKIICLCFLKISEALCVGCVCRVLVFLLPYELVFITYVWLLVWVAGVRPWTASVGQWKVVCGTPSSQAGLVLTHLVSWTQSSSISPTSL